MTFRYQSATIRYIDNHFYSNAETSAIMTFCCKSLGKLFIWHYLSGANVPPYVYYNVMSNLGLACNRFLMDQAGWVTR